MNSHTPGPAMTPHGIAWQLGVDIQTAKIMHAAPAMLEALRELVARRDRACEEANCPERLNGSDGRYARARAILAQVEGR